MGDAFLKKKWERVFYTFFDINRNRAIDWNDFEMMFEEIKKLRGENSTEYKIASDAMGAVWRGLLQDTKGIDMAAAVPEDTKVSIEEWDAMWKKFNPDHMHMWQSEYLKYMFFLLDSSGDKYIDKQEYTEVMKIYGMSKSDAEKAFSELAYEDNKKIDKVDWGQFMKLWNEYFTSTDKKSHGNSLFGPW